jgi:hypothetical protein
MAHHELELDGLLCRHGRAQPLGGYNFDTDTWVTFKLFGGMGLMFVFVLAQALYLSRYMKDTEDTKGPQA